MFEQVNQWAWWRGVVCLMGWTMAVCIGPAEAWAQSHASPGSAPHVRFRHLGTADGLSHRSVTAIAQDSTGYLWFGTQNGLNRYDGVSMRTYRHARGDSTSLPGSLIGTLHVTPDGTLWVGTQAGLARFDRRTESFYSLRAAAKAAGCGVNVTALQHDARGGLWVGTLRSGLCRMDRRTGRFTLLQEPDSSVTAGRVTSLARLPSGAVWVSQSYGSRSFACRLDPKGPRCVPGTRHSQDWPVLWASRHGTLYALDDERGVLRYDAETATFQPDFAAPTDRWGLGPIAPAAGQVWAGTLRYGLIALDLDARTARRIAPSPSDPTSLRGYDVKTVFTDRQGILWVGHERGVSYWTGADQPFQPYDRTDGLSDTRVNGIHEARDGIVWIATNSGLNRLDPTTDRIRAFHPAPPPSPQNAFWQVYEDRAGTLWVGVKTQGLLRFDREAERFSSLEMRTYGVRYLGEDRAGRLWVGSSNGLYVRDPATGRTRSFRTSGAPEDLPSDRANIVHQTPDGALWVGTDEGLARLHGIDSTGLDGAVRFRTYRYAADDPASLGASIVWTMTHTERDPGALWVGTFGGGLCRLDRAMDRFRCLTTADGLPHNVIYGVLTDPDGALWVTTDDGLARVEPRTERITVFGADDGLQGNAFDLMAYHRGWSGRLYVGGPQGLNAFDPSDVAPDSFAPPVVISGVRVFDRRRPGLPAPEGDTLHVRHNRNHVTFDLAALDYMDPASVRYRYRLNGIDADWRLTTGQRPFASYTDLPPGRYRFSVQATNHAGRWSDRTARLAVVVEPAWWQTAWVRWGLVVLGLGLAAGAVRARFVLLRRQQREQIRVQRRLAAERRRERQRLARDLHDGPMQDLYRVGHDVDRLAQCTPGPADDVHTVRRRLNEVADALRAVLVALRPPHLDALGLPAALRSLARAMETRHPALAVATDLTAVDLSDDAEYALYRIAQEALTNAARHAEATRVTMRLTAAPSEVHLTVTDDGCGFVVPARLMDLTKDEHFGLVGAAERAAALGGHLTVRSTPGRGTTVRVAVGRDAIGEKREG